MFGFFGPWELLIILFMILMTAVLLVWPACRICGKAGFPPALGLLMFIPFGNIGLLLFLAFADWPALNSNTLSSEH